MTSAAAHVINHNGRTYLFCPADSLCKIPGWYRRVFLSQSTRFESTDFASVWLMTSSVSQVWSTPWSKTLVNGVCQQWSYHSLVQNHCYMDMCDWKWNIKFRAQCKRHVSLYTGIYCQRNGVTSFLHSAIEIHQGLFGYISHIFRIGKNFVCVLWYHFSHIQLFL